MQTRSNAERPVVSEAQDSTVTAAEGFRFNRMEFAGSLGDLGTLLPLAIGMILINGINPLGLFLSVGLFYILTGLYYRITVPIQPMKVVSAYAIATGMAASEIAASGLWLAVLLLIIGGTGLMTLVGRYVPKSVIRGVQLSTGILLMSEGVRFIIGQSRFQVLQKSAEPYLAIQTLGPVPIGIIIGIIGVILTFLLLENRKLPAGLIVVFGGIAVGLALGTHEGMEKLSIGFRLPSFLPYGFPAEADFTLAFLVLVLPQIPMSLGNAVIAYADLAQDYFGPSAERVTYRSVCLSMGLANLFAFLVGGMPLCHGAGGLAAHYRFGARSGGSNLMIGGIFVVLAILFGNDMLSLLYLIPMAVLGVLLFFAGSQLGLTIIDLKERKDLFVALIILGITLATNLAVGFGVGIAAAYALKSDRLTV